MVDGITACACTTPAEGNGLLYFAGWSDGKADDPWWTWEQVVEKHEAVLLQRRREDLVLRRANREGRFPRGTSQRRGSYYSSPVAADGRIYVTSLPGKLKGIEAGGDQPEILHQVEFGERIHASPAMAGNNFYLCTQSALYAFGEPVRP